jgi:hypothetical protein
MPVGKMTGKPLIIGYWIFAGFCAVMTGWQFVTGSELRNGLGLQGHK